MIFLRVGCRATRLEELIVAIIPSNPAIRRGRQGRRPPGARRIDDLTVEGVVEQQCDVVKWVNGTGLAMPENHPSGG